MLLCVGSLSLNGNYDNSDFGGAKNVIFLNKLIFILHCSVAIVIYNTQV